MSFDFNLQNTDWYGILVDTEMLDVSYNFRSTAITKCMHSTLYSLVP